MHAKRGWVACRGGVRGCCNARILWLPLAWAVMASITQIVFVPFNLLQFTQRFGATWTFAFHGGLLS